MPDDGSLGFVLKPGETMLSAGVGGRGPGSGVEDDPARCLACGGEFSREAEWAEAEAGAC